MSATTNPALLPLLLLSVLPVGAAAVHSARARFPSFKRWNALQRRVRVFSWLLLDVDAAAELRSDTAQDALLNEHRRLTVKITDEGTHSAVATAVFRQQRQFDRKVHRTRGTQHCVRQLEQFIAPRGQAGVQLVPKARRFRECFPHSGVRQQTHPHGLRCGHVHLGRST